MRKKYTLLFFTLLVYISGVAYYAVEAYSKEKNEALAHIDRQLLLATETAQLLSGDAYHERISSEDGIGKEEFLALTRQLSDFAKIAGVKYLYSFMQKDGEILFVSTSLTDKEWEEEGEQVYEKNYKLLYEEATPALKKLFSKPQPLYEESRDQWGYFRSLLIPYKDARGSVYVVGADVEISDVAARMSTALYSAMLTALFYLLIVMPFFLALWFMARSDNAKLQALVDVKTEELQLLNRDLERRVAQELEKNQLQTQLNFQQNKLAQMGEMLSMIAHQWRQPLAVLSAKASYMLIRHEMGTIQDADITQSNELVLQQCQKMSQTINTFMNFVKPDEQRKLFSVKGAVETVMQMMQAQLASHGIAAELIEADSDVRIEGHENLFEQVLVNLFSNARDAFESSVSADKKITITVKYEKSLPVVSVEDNAGGIPEAIREKIFNPYFTSKEEGKGTGIGLYMSKDIMDKGFGGTLQYTPLEGGSRFEMICCMGLAG